jgi:hypothetical protein
VAFNKAKDSKRSGQSLPAAPGCRGAGAPAGHGTGARVCAEGWAGLWASSRLGHVRTWKHGWSTEHGCGPAPPGPEGSRRGALQEGTKERRDTQFKGGTRVCLLTARPSTTHASHGPWLSISGSATLRSEVSCRSAQGYGTARAGHEDRTRPPSKEVGRIPWEEDDVAGRWWRRGAGSKVAAAHSCGCDTQGFEAAATVAQSSGQAVNSQRTCSRSPALAVLMPSRCCGCGAAKASCTSSCGRDKEGYTESCLLVFGKSELVCGKLREH